jgi:hypothetical protein
MRDPDADVPPPRDPAAPRIRRQVARSAAGAEEPVYECHGIEDDAGNPRCDGPNVRRYHVTFPNHGPERDTDLCTEHVAELRGLGAKVEPVTG